MVVAGQVEVDVVALDEGADALVQDPVSYETMLELCNRTGKHAWLCVPHQANDQFLQEFAQLVARLLRKDLKVFVEYSNEVWNGAFAQHRWAKERAKSSWPDYYVARSRAVFEAFTSALGAERTIRVLATQHASPAVTRQILAHLPPGAADVQAGGSYTLDSNGGGTKTLSITETKNGKVTRFSVDGTSYKWDGKRKHYHATAGDGPIKWEYYEFTSSGDEGVYNYKKRAVAGNVLDSGTATMD